MSGVAKDMGKNETEPPPRNQCSEDLFGSSRKCLRENLMKFRGSLLHVDNAAGVIITIVKLHIGIC